MSEVEIINAMEEKLTEIRSIDAQLTASRQRTNEMKLRPRRETRDDYADELDWRRRATFAKTKLLEEYTVLKNDLKVLRIERDASGNAFTARLKAAAQFVVMAEEKGTREDLRKAIEGLRHALGEAAP